MTKIVLDTVAAQQIRSANEQALLCDAEGKPLGYFIPGATSAWDLCPFTDDEIAEAMNETGGRPLDDILRDFRARS